MFYELFILQNKQRRLRLEIHTLLALQPQEFWNLWSSFFPDEGAYDPAVSEAVRISLSPWPRNGLLNVHILLPKNTTMKYLEQVRKFIQALEKFGWLVKNLTKEEEDIDAIRTRIGVNTQTILHEVMPTNASYLVPILTHIIKRLADTDERFYGVGIEAQALEYGNQFVIGWDTLHRIGYVGVIPINQIDSLIQVVCYQSVFLDEESIDSFQAGKNFLTQISNELSEIFIKKKFCVETLGISTGEESHQLVADHLEPWESIPDHSWDREAVRLWCNGYSYKQIGRALGLSQGRISNRFSDLRKKGFAIPMDEARKHNRMPS